MCQALLDWFLLLLATTGLVLGRGGLVLDWFRGAEGTTLQTKPVVRSVAQQPTFDQNSQLPASQPVGAAAVCSYFVAMGTSQLPASLPLQSVARPPAPASCQPVRGPKRWCQPVASQLAGHKMVDEVLVLFC